MIVFEDNWGNDAKNILTNVDSNIKILITKLSKTYSYDECKQFNLIASCCTGNDHIENRDIPIISLQDETDFLKDVHATSEMTWALIMALVRKLPAAHNHVIEGGWERERFRGAELHGKSLGIVGMGRIGTQILPYASAFGMTVCFYDPKYYLDTETPLEYILKNADIISVHVPLNDETKGMFSYDQFKLMKPTSFFINTSRGAIVDEQALIWALENKIIAGAALDVVQNEPKPWARLLHYASKHDNLILTPHLGGNTAESRKSTQLFVANKIKEYIKNK